MLKIFKTLFLNLTIFLMLLELSSFIGVKYNFFAYPSIPSYGKALSFIDTEWRNESELWGAWHKKNYVSKSKKSCFDVIYKTNNIGARDNSDYFKDSEGILLLGDSFIEGVGVNFEKTFAAKLETLGEKVLNFSSAGDFGPLQEYIIYKQLASSFGHDEVIIFFLPANDFTDNSFNYQESLFGKRYRPYFKKNNLGSFDIFYPDDSKPSHSFPSSERKDSFKLKSFLIDYFYSANLLRQFRLAILGSDPKIQRIFNEGYGYNFDEKSSIDGVLYYYSELFKSIPKDVIKTFFVIPTDRDLREIQSNKWGYRSLYWYQGIKKITEENNVSLVDLALKNNLPSEELLKQGMDDWFLKCDGHWNANGHEYAFTRYLEHKNKKVGSEK
jgi:hypothetical protein